MSQQVLAKLEVSPLRRLFGLAALAFLGGLLVYVAALHPPQAPGWRLFLLVLAAGTFALAEAMRRATTRPLILRRDGLFDSAGRPLARMEDIVGLERGMFAMKPSNGFTLRLKRPGRRVWAPGVWWRLGRWVGVGGVTSAPQARIMADILTAQLSGQDGTGGPRDGA